MRTTRNSAAEAAEPDSSHEEVLLDITRLTGREIAKDPDLRFRPLRRQIYVRDHLGVWFRLLLRVRQYKNGGKIDHYPLRRVNAGTAAHLNESHDKRAAAKDPGVDIRLLLLMMSLTFDESVEQVADTVHLMRSGEEPVPDGLSDFNPDDLEALEQYLRKIVKKLKAAEFTDDVCEQAKNAINNDPIAFAQVCEQALTDPENGILHLATFVLRIALRVYFQQHGFADTLADMTLEHAPVEIRLAYETGEILIGGTRLALDMVNMDEASMGSPQLRIL